MLYTLFSGTMFESAVYTDFFGIPMIAMDYTGTVIPVIFVVYFASKCEKFFNKFIPDLVKIFLCADAYAVGEHSGRLSVDWAAGNLWFYADCRGL